jgi:hypothetical protein
VSHTGADALTLPPDFGENARLRGKDYKQQAHEEYSLQDIYEIDISGLLVASVVELATRYSLSAGL